MTTPDTESTAGTAIVSADHYNTLMRAGERVLVPKTDPDEPRLMVVRTRSGKVAIRSRACGVSSTVSMTPRRARVLAVALILMAGTDTAVTEDVN